MDHFDPFSSFISDFECEHFSKYLLKKKKRFQEKIKMFHFLAKLKSQFGTFL